MFDLHESRNLKVWQVLFKFPNISNGGCEQPHQSSGKEESVKELRKARKGKLGACTRKMNELKRIMEEDKDAVAVRQGFKVFQSLCEDFKNAHDAVQTVLPEKEKKIDKVEWFEPRVKPFEDFLKDVEDWEKSIEAQQEKSEQQESPKEGNAEPVEQEAGPVQQEGALELPESTDLQNLVHPHDSVSNVSRARSSSVASAHRRALAEKAALLAHKKALNAKHALEQQKLILDSKIENAELEAEIAASDAKINVLASFDTQSGIASQYEDGMNSYLESHRQVLPLSRQQQ